MLLAVGSKVAPTNSRGSQNVVLIAATRHNTVPLPTRQLPEPVFGQFKQPRGFRQFPMRGVEKVRAPNGGIVCTAHNLLKRLRGAVCDEC